MTTQTLTLSGQQAAVDTLGGRLVRCSVGGHELLAGTEDPAWFAFRGALLAPWPNRVAGARWTWQGRELSLPVNDPGSGSALHGLVYDAEFAISASTASSIELTHDLAASDGYPFPLRIAVGYALTGDGISCSLTASNTGTDRAPVGLGVHPYVAAPTLVDDLVLTVPAATLLETDAAWRETGRTDVAAAGLDFRRPRRIGDLALDNGFTDVEHGGSGRTVVTVGLPDGREVEVWSGATCRWWLIYTGHTLAPSANRRSLAVEPMTCPPDALNGGEIDVLAPGEALRLDWGFRVQSSLG